MNLEALRASLVELHLDHAAELDDAAKGLLASIEGRYAEFSDGIVSEVRLKQRLASLCGAQETRTASVPNALSYLDLTTEDAKLSRSAPSGTMSPNLGGSVSSTPNTLLRDDDLITA